jgi:hypothetical protein
VPPADRRLRRRRPGSTPPLPGRRALIMSHCFPRPVKAEARERARTRLCRQRHAICSRASTRSSP